MMFNILDFIKYLWRYKWLTISVSCICGVAAFFIAKELPKTYKSNVQLSTGITDRSKEILSGDRLDYYIVSQQFGNIIELMNTKRVLNILSLQLILHDLENLASPFTVLPEDLAQLPKSDLAEIIDIFKHKQANNELMTPADNGKYPLFDWLKIMGYDQKTISNSLIIYRHGESDFINVEYTSTNPQLSAFAVNTFVKEFIYYYTHVMSNTKQSTLLLLDSILAVKKTVMDEKNAQLRSFKAGSGVLNLSSQSDMLYQQIAEQESRRSQLVSEIQSLQGGIRSIAGKLNGELGAGSVSNTKENNEIVQIGRQLEQANRRYFENNFDPQDKKIIDSLELLRSTKIAALSRQSTSNPEEIRSALVKEKSDLEIALARAENSISSINAELSRLRGRFGAMVPTDAGFQNLEREAELAVTEYTDAMNRYNQATLESSAALNLRVVEHGFPGLPEPGKVKQLTALSGAASFILVNTILLLLFLLDNSIRTSEQLTAATGRSVVGGINHIQGGDKDLRVIWDESSQTEDHIFYCDLLRSLRFEINKSINETDKVLGITSLSDGAGKTFVAASLAYAFALINKKVLLIGDDYPNLTELISNKQQNDNQGFESFLVKKEIMVEDRITVLNKNPNSKSLLEINGSKSLITAFEILRKEFDVILLDLNSLKHINQVKEWLLFADKSVAIFEAGSRITAEDRNFLKLLDNHEGFLGWIINKVKI